MASKDRLAATLPDGFELADDEKKPNARMIAFAYEYARCRNRSQAAQAVGYAHPQRGSQIMSDYPVVRRLVGFLTLQIEKQANVNAAWLLTELAHIAKANIMDFFTVDPVTGEFSMDPRVWNRDDCKAIERLVITDTFAADGAKVSQKIEFRLTPKGQIFRTIGEHIDVSAFKEDQLREQGNALAERLTRAAERVAAYHAGQEIPVEDEAPRLTTGESEHGESDTEHDQVGRADGLVGEPEG